MDNKSGRKRRTKEKGGYMLIIIERPEMNVIEGAHEISDQNKVPAVRIYKSKHFSHTIKPDPPPRISPLLSSPYS